MGQDSIDNEYLFVALTQGWVGFLSLCLLALAAMYHLTMAAIFNPRKNDRVFAFSLLGIMVGLLVTIYTVFLGNQPYELFFLLVGWSQAVRVRVAERPAFAFAQVYT
jgi:cytochrome c biogenesis protein CcdA